MRAAIGWGALGLIAGGIVFSITSSTEVGVVLVMAGVLLAAVAAFMEGV